MFPTVLLPGLALIAFDRPTCFFFPSCRATVSSIASGHSMARVAQPRQGVGRQASDAGKKRDMEGRRGPIGAPNSLLTSIQLLFISRNDSLLRKRPTALRPYCILRAIAIASARDTHALLFLFLIYSHCPAHEFETPCEERKKRRSLCRSGVKKENKKNNVSTCQGNCHGVLRAPLAGAVQLGIWHPSCLVNICQNI